MWTTFHLYIMVRTRFFLRKWYLFCTRPIVVTEMDFHSASYLKQQSTDRHVASFWHINLTEPSNLYFLTLNTACLAEEQQIQNYLNTLVYILQSSGPENYFTLLWYLIWLECKKTWFNCKFLFLWHTDQSKFE